MWGAGTRVAWTSLTRFCQHFYTFLTNLNILHRVVGFFFFLSLSNIHRLCFQQCLRWLGTSDKNEWEQLSWTVELDQMCRHQPHFYPHSSLITHHSSLISHQSSIITHHWWQLKLPQMVGHCPNGDPTNEPPWGRTMKNRNCPKWWGAAPKDGGHGQANKNVFLFGVWELEYIGTQGGLAIHWLIGYLAAGMIRWTNNRCLQKPVYLQNQRKEKHCRVIIDFFVTRWYTFFKPAYNFPG